MSWEMTKTLIRVFSGIFLCSVTGSVLFFYWKPISRYLEKKGDAKLNYAILKIIVVAFFVPVLSIIFEDLSHKSYLFSTTTVIRDITEIIGVIWLAGATVSGCFYFLKYRRLRKSLENSCICSRQTQKIADECRKNCVYGGESMFTKATRFPCRSSAEWSDLRLYCRRNITQNRNLRLFFFMRWNIINRGIFFGN